jgi:IS1 family transposase
MKTTEQMDASQVFCPNLDCMARGKIGEGHIVIHGKKRQRYRCKTCGKTFSAQAGTMFAGLRKPRELIVIVVTLLAYGCPVQAIVHAFELDERTVASWRDRAGKHCQQVHQAVVQQGQLDLVHVQADEIRVKGHKMIAWMGLAMMVSTRLWLGGVVSLTRDRSLADRLLAQVRACCQPLRALLVCTDGWKAYPGSIRRAFREKVKESAGRGRACLRVWPQLCIATVIKRTEKKRVVQVTRQMALGTLKYAQALLAASQGGTVLNTAFIERLNGTMRERLASLTRKCRHAARRLTALESGMWLLGCTYNWCWPHHELSRRAAKAQGKPGEVLLTPAMASGLTDHIWVRLFAYRGVAREGHT